MDLIQNPAYPCELSGSSHLVIPNPSSKRLMIFFSGTDRREGRFDFWNVGRKQDANLIFVNGDINAWYQLGVPGLGNSIEETAETFKRWAVALGCNEIFTFGISMGGYGAVLYGAKLNAKVLAFGFDTRLKIDGSRSKKRMPARVKVVVPDLRPIMKAASSEFTVVAGEADIMDLLAASRIVDLPNTTVITLRGVGHGAAPFLETKYGLAEVIAGFADGKGVPTPEEVGNMAECGEAVELLWRANEHYRAERFDHAKAYANSALVHANASEAVMHLLGCIEQDRGNVAEAARYFALVTTLVPHFGGAQLRLATCLRLLGRRSPAISAYMRYLEIKPDSAGAYFHVGCLHQSSGDLVGAIEFMKKAVQFDPEKLQFRERLKRLESECKKQYGTKTGNTELRHGEALA